MRGVVLSGVGHAARQRGLDEDARQAAAPKLAVRMQRSGRRMNPGRHARTLLKETSLPFDEIADITGLDVYQVVGMKLKLRGAG